MFLLCGLGNTGARYRNTRHNIGYVVIDRYAEAFKVPMGRRIAGCVVGESELALLAKPDTFMNLSGGPVASLMKRRRIQPERLVVIHDDLDMEIGRLRLKWDGGDGGHKGVRSVTEALGTPLFLRVKIGIGRDPVIPPDEYVLSPITRAEKAELAAALDRAVDALHTVVADGMDRAMNLFNR